MTIHHNECFLNGDNYPEHLAERGVLDLCICLELSKVYVASRLDAYRVAEPLIRGLNLDSQKQSDLLDDLFTYLVEL